MIPAREHPRWKELVAGSTRFAFENLALRMLVTRLRLRTVHGDAAPIEEAITAVHDFFERNEDTCREDLHTLFGEQP
ncbi:MAG: hypothetical protein ACOZQL_39620 [Myxococcota bacterium]